MQQSSARPGSVTTGPIRGSRKVHSAPPGHPQLKVPLREIALDDPLSPTLHLYDTSGPYTEDGAVIDLAAGLPALREGWLAARGFHDFAGSTIVHSVGGWGALIGAIMLGPRLGKYTPDGKSRAIAGHSMPLATIGVFILWLGWFGFNGGSVLSADPGAVSLVLVTTNLAAAAGVVASMLVSWIVQKKPDLSMILNGALAGLVGITAGADCVTPMEAIAIGAIAGAIVVLAVLLIDQKLRIDDPVGAISVHLVCGIFGTLAAGIFGEGKSVVAQLAGIGLTAAFCIPSALVLFGILKATLGIRVDEGEERRGLDIGEHGMEAYGGFQIFTNQ